MQDRILPDHRPEHHPTTPSFDRELSPHFNAPASSWLRGPELRALGAAVREVRARRGFSQELLGFHASTHRNYIGGIAIGHW